MARKRSRTSMSAHRPTSRCRSSTLVNSNIKPAPIVINHQGMFPSATISFNLKPGVALGDAVDAIRRFEKQSGKPASVATSFQGNAQAFQASLASTPILIAASLVVIYIILGVLYESTIHPITILSTLPSAGHRRAAAADGGASRSQRHRHHRHHPADRHRQEERHHAGRLRAAGRTRAKNSSRRSRSIAPARCASGRS